MITSSSRDGIAAALPLGYPVLGAAAAVWVGCAVGLGQGPRLGPLVGVAAVVAVGAGIVVRGATAKVLAALVVAGIGSGVLAAARTEAAATVPVASGRHALVARVLSDPATGKYGTAMLVRASGASLAGEITMLASLDGAVLAPGEGAGVGEGDGDGEGEGEGEGEGPGLVAGILSGIAAGDQVIIDGIVSDRPGRYRGDRYRASVEADHVALAAAATGPFFGPGNLLRRTVIDGLADDRSEAAALVAGFLVGHTDGLSERRLDELRRAGLTHFVAVSGSNVAIFLAAWWLVIGPFGLDPRLRAGLGIVALGAFVVATRWEPSVIRAGSMAAVVLGGRIVGVPVDPWRALGLAVTGLLLFSADLALDVGFQLSVAATAGVLVAVALTPRRRPRWLWAVLLGTAGAQLAVLPILLARFGTVPLLSPIANVVAVPLVTTATVVGGIGALTGFAPALDLGLVAAGGVLVVASVAAGWPQLGVVGVLGVGAVAASFWLGRRLRPVLAGVAAAALIAWGLPVGPPDFPVVVFLDVGQGDAILIRDPPSSVVLVDGGPDPLVLGLALRRHGVGAIDLVVVTHGDADHAGGLQGLVGERSVGAIWYPAGQPVGGLLDDLLVEAATAGVPVAAVGAGDGATLGRINLALIGPGRRYAADNDGSIVMRVTAGGTEVLLTGDVGAIAQAELPAVAPDVLQVPHHGSSTTDLGWLAATVGPVAVISVGDNTFGHPTAEVLETLARAGATVMTTIDQGDIVVPLCPCPNNGHPP